MLRGKTQASGASHLAEAREDIWVEKASFLIFSYDRYRQHEALLLED